MAQRPPPSPAPVLREVAPEAAPADPARELKLRQWLDAAATRDIFGWKTGSVATWTDGQGLTWTAAGGDVQLSPASPFLPHSASGSDWLFRVRGARDGPGGLTFTARAGARRGYSLPSYLADVVGSDHTLRLPGRQLFLPGDQKTVWDAAVGLERRFDVGKTEIGIIGEAIALVGHADAGANAPPPAAPKRPARGLRLGTSVKF